MNAVHEREVNHQATVADTITGHVMSAAAYRDGQAPVPRQADGGDHARTPRYERWALVHHTVPHQTGLVVVVVRGPDDDPAQPRLQFLREVASNRFLAVSSGFGDRVGVVPAWRVDEGVIVSLAA